MLSDKSALPLQPGYSYRNVRRENFGVSQTLEYSKGCPRAKTLIPDTAQFALELLDGENKLHDKTLVDLTYGSKISYLSKAPLPDSVIFDSKEVLCFYGYYREDVENSWIEKYRIHHVKIIYYLGDNTFEIYEPQIRNSGMPQGLVLKRINVPRPDGIGNYHWKNLNLGIDIIVFGKKITIYECDPYTESYLESGGIELNPRPVDIPKDPYIEQRKKAEAVSQYITPKVEDEKLWKFLNKDRLVLRFNALWDDTVNNPKQKIKVVIQYYLRDDTIELLHIHQKNDGYDPYPMLISKQKIPVELESVPDTFPSCFMEYTDNEVKEYYKPEHLGVGKTLIIYQRKIFIYDCDQFTRNYYQKEYGIQLEPAINVEDPLPPVIPQPVPPHTGFGSWEDSLQSCLRVIPQPPRKDVIKAMCHDNKILRYTAYMDTNWPIDASRRFVITVYLGDDTVGIHETSIRNSGIAGGGFLKRTRLVKKQADNKYEPPDYYDASDFYIGAVILCSGRRFVIDNADDYVLTFMKENRHIYTEDNIRVHEEMIECREKTKEGTDTQTKESIIQKLDEGFCKMQQDKNCKSLLKKYLTKQVYQKLRSKRTNMGATLMDVVQSGLTNLDSGIGVYAPDAEAYTVFADLFNPIIEEYHKGFGSRDRHPFKNFGNIDRLVNLDPSGQYVISTRVRCGRSLQGYPFNPCLTKQQYREIEKKAIGTLTSLVGELKGTYYPLTGMQKATQQQLIDDHFLFKEGDRFLQAANACRFWPTGRGIFHNDSKTFLVWVNEEDHLRIISMENRGNLKQVYKRLIDAVNAIEAKLPFSRDDRLGFLTFCPTNLGTTIRASVHIRLPNLAKDKANLLKTADKYNLQVRGTRGEHTESEGGVYDISNKRRIGLTEYEAVKEMQDGILELIECERHTK